MSKESIRAAFEVVVETREGGDYYFDHDDLVANVIPWIEDGLSDRDDLTKVSVVTVPHGISEDPQEPDHPAAHALAQYIASHPASTVMAACRYLGWKLDFTLLPKSCPQCGDSGACAGGPCPMLDEPSIGLCIACKEQIVWVDKPEGGSWRHFGDAPLGHHPDPGYGGCPAALLPQGNAPVSNCVVQGGHVRHRAVNGESWMPDEEG